MADLVLDNCRVFIGTYDVSGQLNSVALEAAVELLDATDFASGGVRERLPGLRTVAMQVEGKVDGSTVDAALFDGIGLYDVPVAVIPVPTVGQLAYLFRAALADYSPGGAVGELMRFSAGAEASGGSKLISGQLAINITAAIASGNGTALQLGAVGATQTMFAGLFVLSASVADTLDVIVQSDNAVGFPSATNRIVFPQMTAIGSAWGSVAGPVTDDWWRVNYTIGGSSPSFSFAVVLGIGLTV